MGETYIGIDGRSRRSPASRARCPTSSTSSAVTAGSSSSSRQGPGARCSRPRGLRGYVPRRSEGDYYRLADSYSMRAPAVPNSTATPSASGFSKSSGVRCARQVVFVRGARPEDSKSKRLERCPPRAASRSEPDGEPPRRARGCIDTLAAAQERPGRPRQFRLRSVRAAHARDRRRAHATPGATKRCPLVTEEGRHRCNLISCGRRAVVAGAVPDERHRILGEQHLQGSFVKPGKEMPRFARCRAPSHALRPDARRTGLRLTSDGALYGRERSSTPRTWYRSGTNQTMRTHLATHRAAKGRARGLVQGRASASI